MTPKMKNCKACGKEIAASAKICPNCGAKNSKPIFKRWWFWVIIVVIVLGILGSGGDSSSTDDNTTTPQATTDTTKQTTDDKKQEANQTTTKKEDSKYSTPADKFTWIAENNQEMGPFEIPADALEVIKQHPDFFPGNDKNTGAMSDLVNYDTGYVQLAKDITKCNKELVTFGGYIVDIKEQKTEWGTYSYIQVADYEGNNYVVYYLGALENAYEKMDIDIDALPIAMTAFENMNGAYTEAAICAGAYASVWDGDSEDY